MPPVCLCLESERVDVVWGFKVPRTTSPIENSDANSVESPCLSLADAAQLTTKRKSELQAVIETLLRSLESVQSDSVRRGRAYRFVTPVPLRAPLLLQ